MSDPKLNAYYYSFAPTGQRVVDLILHAVARAGKAFHHTSQWTEDEMAEFYEHCEGDTCVEWIQNAANKAAAELATLRAERDALRAAGEAALRTLDNVRVFVTSRERIHKPSGEEWFEGCVKALRAALEER